MFYRLERQPLESCSFLIFLNLVRVSSLREPKAAIRCVIQRSHCGRTSSSTQWKQNSMGKRKFCLRTWCQNRPQNLRQILAAVSLDLAVEGPSETSGYYQTPIFQILIWQTWPEAASVDISYESTSAIRRPLQCKHLLNQCWASIDDTNRNK